MKNMRYIVSLLLLLVSMCAMSQSDIKDLEKKAKKGDVVAQRLTGIGYLEGYKVDNKKAFKWLSLAAEGGDAEAMYRLGNMYEDGKVKDGNSEMAWSWYVKAANVGNVESQMLLANSLKEQNKITEAKDWYFRAAFQENADAQYEYAMILLSESNESEAKSWFKKAADKNHVLAKIKYDAILQHEREVAEAEAKRLALEAARRDSIARVEAERRRVQDSIDYATGVKQRPYRELIRDCNYYIVPPSDYYQSSLRESDFYRKFTTVSQNDLFAYFGKSNLSGLDKELYKQSEQYKADLAEFQRKKQEKYAIVGNIENPSSFVKFEADGIVFRDNWSSYVPRNFGLSNHYIEFSNILFPIQQSFRTNDGLKFKTSDLQLLQRIRSQNKHLSVLFIFKPSASVLYNERFEYYFHVTNLLALYLVDNETGETLLDMSKYVRKINFQTEKQRVLSGVRKYEAGQRAAAPKKHSTPKQERCAYCGGQGYIEYFPVGSATLTKTRCTNCYGKGYTLEYYY